jgi:predicted secreted hydrolase
MKVGVAFGLCGALALAALLGRQAAVPAARATEVAPLASGFQSAGTPFTFSFPRDHAAHPLYQSEWWYYTGHLVTPNGRRFGYELTFFRVGMRPGDPPPRPGESAWRGTQLYPAHFAITDEAGKQFFHTDRFAREALGMGAAASDRLAVKVLDWSLNGTTLRDPRFEQMTLHARESGAPNGAAALDLVQTPLKAPAIHGRDGISKKGPCASCASHYYSYTRLRSRGTLTFGGQRFPVDGISWMDHEFGSSELQPDQTGWDWYSLQLDDGRELMLYLLRRRQGRVTAESSGSLIERDGRVEYLPLDAFSAVATGSWKSPHTGATYPSGWRVRVPRAGIDVVLTPVLADQELALSGGVSYWEGAVEVTSQDRPARRTGVGYVELTGYAGTVAL